MWSGAFFTFMTVFLQGVHEPRNLKFVTLPFLLSCLLDLDELHVNTRAFSGLTFFHLPAIALVGFFEVWAHLCNMIKSVLNVHQCVWWTHIVTWLQSGHIIAQGATIHFVMQLVIRSSHPLVGIGLTVSATLCLWVQYRYMLMPVHGETWSWLYHRICVALSILNSMMVAWLGTAYANHVAEDPYVYVNALSPLLCYLPVVIHCVCHSSPNEDAPPSGVKVELNEIRQK